MNSKNPFHVVIFIFLLIGAFWLIWQLQSVIILLFIVLTISVTLQPPISFLERRYKIPRIISAILLLSIISFAISFLLQSLVKDISIEYEELATSLIENFNSLEQKYNLKAYIATDIGKNTVQQISQTITTGLRTTSKELINVGTSVFSSFLTIVTAITLIFYLLSDPKKIQRFAFSFLEDKYKNKAKEIAARVEKKLSFWLAGQIFLMLLMGFISFIGFKVIDIEFALPLAVIVGILDIIPVIGPIIAFIPVLLVTLVTNPIKAILVSIFFLIIQQLEGNVLVPRIMSKSVGLDPVAVLISLTIGSTLAGVTGALLSIPVAVILMIFYQEYLEWRKNKQQRKPLQPEISPKNKPNISPKNYSQT